MKFVAGVTFLLTIANYSVVHLTMATEFRIGAILPFANKYPWSVPKTGPAILYALEAIRNNSILPKDQLVVNFSDSQCSETYGPLAAIDMVLRRPPSVFLGPACDYAVAPIARFSPHWNIPVITGGALGVAFVDKANQYRLLTRIGGSYAKIGNFLVAIFRKFNWSTSLLIYTSNLGPRQPLGRSNQFFIMQGVYATMSSEFNRLQTKRGVHHLVFDENAQPEEAVYQDAGKIMRDASTNARIVVLCASPDSVREIMIRAAEYGFVNGEYVFFNIDLLSSKELMERPWYRANETEERNLQAKKAYEALMTITLRTPDSDDYKRFSEEVKRRATAEYGNMTYMKDEEVNSFVTAFHDGVILYALALNETITAGRDPTNGTEITGRMWNRTFKGITGEVSIDENGDRNADYSLLDMDQATGKFHVVAHYYGSRKEYHAIRNIHWPGGKTGPPPDTPVCGYDNSKCNNGFPLWGYVIIILVALLLIVSLVAGLAFWKVYVNEKITSEKYWRVPWNDINQTQPGKGRRSSIVSLRHSGLEDEASDAGTLAGDGGGRQLFIETGTYKKEVVAIKKVDRSIRKQITSMKVLKEIKRLRDLQNDHVVRFIGVCIDEGHESIITLYCQKGSLQDVLENDDLQLDTMFKLSLIQDIVRGVHYIHGSEVRFHGNLKSSNCVIDSRFVLKLTDFSLHYIRRYQESTERLAEFAHWKSKVWLAPEFLRDQEVTSPEAKQKGDVYSFAIICQEILYRKGPFWFEEDEDMDVKGILS